MRILLVFTLAVLALSCDNPTSVPPDSGIQGRVTMSPMCPVPNPSDPDCAPAPLEATLEVRTQDGRTLARVRSDSDGQYKVAIGPGHYVLHALQVSPTRPPPPLPVEVDVQADAWVTVDLDYDTGIR